MLNMPQMEGDDDGIDHNVNLEDNPDESEFNFDEADFEYNESPQKGDGLPTIFERSTSNDPVQQYKEMRKAGKRVNEGGIDLS